MSELPLEDRSAAAIASVLIQTGSIGQLLVSFAVGLEMETGNRPGARRDIELIALGDKLGDNWDETEAKLRCLARICSKRLEREGGPVVQQFLLTEQPQLGGRAAIDAIREADVDELPKLPQLLNKET